MQQNTLGGVAMIFVAVGSAGAWQVRTLCPSGGNCVRDGLTQVAAHSRGLTIAWWDESGHHQKWDVTEEVLKPYIRCSDGEACSFEHLRGHCYMGCVLDDPVPEAFDPQRHRFYFSLTIYDRRAVMLVADLRAHGIDRVVEERSNGDYVFRQTQLSPSGRYLAYLVTSHATSCEDFAVLRVYDLEKARYVDLPGADERRKTVNETGLVRSDGGFQWQSDAVIAVEQSQWSCRSGEMEENPPLHLLHVKLPKTTPSGRRHDGR